MELHETVEMMESSDYKERFKAEYYQTKIRYTKLGNILKKYADGTLEFKPTCPIKVLEQQFSYMGLYLLILKSRAEIENIDLEEYKYDRYAKETN